jgi:AraC-like DNA-binding protein
VALKHAINSHITPVAAKIRWRGKPSNCESRRQQCGQRVIEALFIQRTVFVSRPDPAISTIRAVIAQLLPDGHPTLAIVADQLDTSPRTLQRRLADNGLSHSQLVHQARLAKAMQLLMQQNVHIGDIARQTGFATPAGFSRAFQSWTGTSPRSFRNNL